MAYGFDSRPGHDSRVAALCLALQGFFTAAQQMLRHPGRSCRHRACRATNMRDDHSTFLSAALGAGADCLIFRGNQLLVDEAGGPPSAWRDYLAAVAPLRVIPTGGGQGGACFVAEVAREAEAPRGHAFLHLKGLLDTLPRALRARAVRSLELLEFDRAHRYCGACGAMTILKPDMIARVCTNDACARATTPARASTSRGFRRW